MIEHKQIEDIEADIAKIEEFDAKVHRLADKGGKNFGLAIRMRRASLNLKAYELANDVGIDPVYITQIETYGKLPSLDIMKRIADVLQDEGLFRIYLKIKYPTMYEKLQKDEAAGEALSLAREFKRIKEDIENIKKDKITPRELKKLGDRIIFFRNAINRSAAHLHYLVGELEKIKKMHTNLKNALKQK